MPYIPTTVQSSTHEAGATSLVYRYTVVGADKSSIDTGVDVPNAGSNDWTNGDLLEIYVYARTDGASIFDSLNLSFNSDGGANYDRINMRDTNITLAQDNVLGSTAFLFNVVGGNSSAGMFGYFECKIPNYLGTTANKTGYFNNAEVDGSDPNNTRIQTGGLGYRSTTGITRLALVCFTGGAKMKVGTQLLVYKRWAS